MDLLSKAIYNKNKKKRILHVITSLNGGGAEAMLFKLIKEIDRNEFEISVISLLDKGVYGEEMEERLGVDLLVVNLNKPLNFITKFSVILRYFKDSQLIHSWMYHANIFSFVFSLISKRKLIWGIHHNDFSIRTNKLSTVLMINISKFFSSKIDKIIYCGDEVKKNHLNYGFSSQNAITIFNGFETEKFNSSHSIDLREKFKLDLNTRVLIHVGRWDILKGYDVLLEAISLLNPQKYNVKLLLIGKGITTDNMGLMKLIEEHKVEDRVILLGRREDVPILMASADYFISSSLSEGFPNVIGEAMLSETVCVVTDTGDANLLLNKHGFISKVGDPMDLSRNIESALNLNEEEYSSKAKESRELIIQNYSLERITKLHMNLYKQLICEESKAGEK